MRLRISTILCLTLFALTNAAPSVQRENAESSKKDEQFADVAAPAPEPYNFMPPSEQGGDAMLNDCCAPGPTCANPCQQPAPAPQSFAINFAQPPPPMAPPPPAPIYTGGDCCPPGPACANPCAPPAPPMMPPPMMAPPMMAPPMMAPPMMAPPMMAPPMAPMGPCCDPSVVQQCANPCGAPPVGADEGQGQEGQEGQEGQDQGQEGEQQTYAPYPGEITFKLMQKWDDQYLNENSAPYKILSGNLEKAIKVALEGDSPKQLNQLTRQNDYSMGMGGWPNPYAQQYDQYGQQQYGQQPYGQQPYGQQPSTVTVSNIYF
ncbi:hypothetical protein QZH41_015338, partial [Actinostola sp. cb2023]